MTSDRTLNENDYLPLRSLNDLLYCERRCAMHRIEGVWTDNAATLEGTFSHKRADKPVTWESANGVREVHGMWLKSDRLRLVGKADVVEFHLACSPPLPRANGEGEGVELPTGTSKNQQIVGTETPRSLAMLTSDVPFPVEYKRGKRRKWDNDDVQLCAQALCLEEMLRVSVPRGAIFHIKTKRRREVEFTDKLRRKTEVAAARLHELIAAGITPPAVLKPQCDGCSLRELCLPEMSSRLAEVSKYMQTMFEK